MFASARRPLGPWDSGDTATSPEDDHRGRFLGQQIPAIRKHTYGDVQGERLSWREALQAPKGFILAGQQIVSAYNIYRTAAPYKFVETPTMAENVPKGLDAVR